MDHESSIIVREATRSDCPAMRILLNEIIQVGGTTAMETPLSNSELEAYYLVGADYLYCNVATTQNDEILGFQSLTRHPGLADNWADIATFARLNPKTRGVGTALFDDTKQFARNNKLVAINATIRSDNVPGLSYYSKMGFVDYSVNKAVPLNDGTLVDRISRKFEIRNG